MAILEPGSAAPDFTLHDGSRQPGLAGGFPRPPRGAGVLSRRLEPGVRRPARAVQRAAPEFRATRELLGISVDGRLVPRRVRARRKLHFPLLADFEPKGDVARAYGAYRDPGGSAERALFVIDADGMIRWSYLSPMGVNPGADGILRRSSRCAAPMTQAHERPRCSVRRDPCARDDHVGPGDAPVTLVEYGDYQCPYCGAAYPLVQRCSSGSATGLRFVFRNFPLDESHPDAEHAAEAAEAADAQGQFWAMHDMLYENQQPVRAAPATIVRRHRCRRPRRRQGPCIALKQPQIDQAHQDGLQRRSPQRRERHAELLHQWQVAPGIAAGRSPRPSNDCSSAEVRRLHAAPRAAACT